MKIIVLSTRNFLVPRSEPQRSLTRAGFTSTLLMTKVSTNAGQVGRCILFTDLLAALEPSAQLLNGIVLVVTAQRRLCATPWHVLDTRFCLLSALDRADRTSWSMTSRQALQKRQKIGNPRLCRHARARHARYFEARRTPAFNLIKLPCSTIM